MDADLATSDSCSESIDRPKRVAVFAFPGCQGLDVLGPLEVFATADALRRREKPSRPPFYTVEIVAPEAGPLRTMSGLQLVADRGLDTVDDDVEASGPIDTRSIDTLLVAGGEVRDAIRTETWIDWLRAQKDRVRRLGSVCTGTFLLAEAGLLDGRRATTHWMAVDPLRRHYPDVEVEPDAVFVCDGVYTSAGVTAGMDLALAMVEQDLGRDMAMDVARYLVIYLRRPGGQSQFSSRLAAQTAEAGPWEELLSWIVEHVAEPLSVERLADRVHLSPRQFSRRFVAQTGITPGKWVEKARVDAARVLLEEREELSLDQVARRCGLADDGALRRLFQRHLKLTPKQYRKRFRRSDRAPTRAAEASQT